MTKKDRRQINSIWEHTNPLGEKYLFARVGTGKNSYIKTLSCLEDSNRSKIKLEDVQRRTKKDRKDVVLSLRVSQETRQFIRKNDLSPSKIFHEALKDVMKYGGTQIDRKNI